MKIIILYVGKKMINVSIVCCYNNREMYEKILVKSLNKQENCEYELIGINNINNEYKDCATALNYGISKACAPYIIAVHQDFEFIDKNTLSDIFKYLKNMGDFDILGAAGALLDENANIFHKIIGRNRKVIMSWENYIENPIIVESLDECCICFKRKLWEEHHFSEELCPAWDLYAVEFCLYARLYKQSKVYVIPMNVEHHSGGNLSTRFYKSLQNVAKYYTNKIDLIVTTCVVIRTKHSSMICKWLILVNQIRLVYKKIFKG